MSPDPYRVLGITPGANLAEIKRAYRALAKVHHPDSAGDAALPRFLAIQGAYEQLLDPRRRAAAATRSRAGSGRSGDPWRADSARAREAKAGAAGPGPAGGGTRGSSSARSGPSAATGPGPGAGAGSGRSGGPSTSAGGTRRRTTRKATFGSTTYDEVHEPGDTTWSGASWYGQTSGEFWRVNPREYADPRKHGPEYQARAASARTRQGPEPAAREPGRTEDAWTSAGAAASRAPGGRRQPPPAPGNDETGFSPPSAAGPPGPGARTAADAPLELSSIFAFHLDLSRLDRLPNRRLVLALLAWPPIGIAAASLIGDATGCAAFAASCTGSAPTYPWIAQVLILGALLIVPGVARILAAGSAAVAVLALPVAAALSAGGATYDRVYGPASLIGLLAVGWLAGVALAAVRRARMLRG